MSVDGEAGEAPVDGGAASAAAPRDDASRNAPGPGTAGAGQAGPGQAAVAEPGRWDGSAAQVPAPEEESTADADRKDGTEAPEESLTLDDRMSQSQYRLDLPAAKQVRDVAGVINNYFGGARQERPPPGRISAAILRQAAAVHVTTDSDGLLRHEAGAQRVMFCRGAPDTGRSHSAVVALDSLTGYSRATSRVIVLDGAPGLEGMLGQMEPGCGHLLDGSGMPWADAIGRGHFNQAREALGVSGYLIILVDADSIQPQAGAVIDHAPPELRQVAVFHLAVQLIGDGPLNDRTLDHARSQAHLLIDEACRVHRATADWLGEITSSTTSGPAEAVLFAEAIWTWHERRRRDSEAEPPVAEFRSRRRHEQAAGLLRRYDSADSPLRQSYAISAAVLDGLALSEIIDGAVDLSARLAEVEHPGEPGQREVFAQPLARWLRHVEMASADPGAGDRGGTVVKMPSRELARIVIEVAWRQYDAARAPVLAWLVTLCERHRDHRVRIRAVQALAFIAAHDYAHIKERVLDVWSAPGSRPVEQLAASWLMEAMVLDGTSADKVLEVLRRWSRSPDRSKRGVAVRAYGTAIASQEPQDAIQGTRISAVLPDLGSLPELSLLEMYLLGLTKEVTAELTLWMRGFPAMRERAGRVLVRISQVRRSGEGESGQPYDLLWLLARAPDEVGASLRQIAELWRLACAHERSRSAAWRMLGHWAESCRDHPELRGTFAELTGEFEKVAGNDEIRDRLGVYRRWWNSYLDEEDPE
jgi:hypothetical protein